MPPDPYSPRKPARQSRARDTVETILQAAGQIVSRSGIATLSTNLVAERAGVSIGSLYQYFPGKDAVLHALIERVFNRSVDELLAYVESIDPAIVPLDQAIGGFIDHLFDAQVRGRPFYRELVLAALSFKHLRFTLQNDARVLAAVRRKLLAYGDLVDPESLDQATFALLHALKGVQLGVVFSDAPADDPTLRALLVRMTLGCLSSAGAPPRRGSAPPDGQPELERPLQRGHALRSESSAGDRPRAS